MAKNVFFLKSITFFDKLIFYCWLMAGVARDAPRLGTLFICTGKADCMSLMRTQAKDGPILSTDDDTDVF